VQLAQVEPRLLKKLVAPFSRILTTNPAKSVEFELIRSICVVFRDNSEMVRLSISRVHGFLDSNDPNCEFYVVKYLGLVALHMLIEIMPDIADEYRIFIIEAMQSRDLTIRLRALGLLKLTTTAGTIQETVKNLIAEAEKPNSAGIKEELVSCCLFLISKGQYELVENFKWMFEVLMTLVELKTATHEAQLSSIIIDVVLRVEELRAEACDIALSVLERFDSLKSDRCEALNALIFIIGEFCSCMSPESIAKAVTLLTLPRWGTLSLHESVHNALSSAIFKLSLRTQAQESQEKCMKKLIDCSAQIEHMEAQERSLLFINITKKGNLSDLANALTPFLPIHPSAQSLIFPPDCLLTPFEVNNEELCTVKEDGTTEFFYYREEDFGEKLMTEQEKMEAKRKLREKQMQDPFYLKPKKGKKKKGKKGKKEEGKVEEMEEKKDEGIGRDEKESVVETKKKYSVNRTQPLIPGQNTDIINS
jgi:hypothetical protein